MKNFHLYIGWILLAGIILWAGCSSKKTEDEQPAGEEQKDSVEVRPEVVFSTADDKPLYQYVESQGVVEANRQMTLKPKISGYVQTSNIVEGRRVERGDTLLGFQKQEWQYALQEAQNKYDKAYSAYKIENRQRKSLDSSFHTAGSDTTQKTDAMVRIATGLAEADVEKKRAQLNLSYATLKAPFSGTLAADHRITEGTYLPAGTEMGQLVNDATVRVRFDVLESELGKVKNGLSVRVTGPGGETIKGTVTAVSPVVDTQSKTGEITVRVSNRSRRLRPGMTVDGRILVRKETGKARIPRSAILSRDGGRTLVFKLNPDNDQVEWVYVTPQAENSDWAIVDNENIAPGDTIAVDNHFALSHLQKVQPKMQSMQREEGENPEVENQN